MIINATITNTQNSIYNIMYTYESISNINANNYDNTESTDIKVFSSVLALYGV